jgi:uncharacterized protein YukE
MKTFVASCIAASLVAQVAFPFGAMASRVTAETNPVHQTRLPSGGTSGGGGSFGGGGGGPRFSIPAAIGAGVAYSVTKQLPPRSQIPLEKIQTSLMNHINKCPIVHVQCVLNSLAKTATASNPQLQAALLSVKKNLSHPTGWGALAKDFCHALPIAPYACTATIALFAQSANGNLSQQGTNNIVKYSRPASKPSPSTTKNACQKLYDEIMDTLANMRTSINNGNQGNGSVTGFIDHTLSELVFHIFMAIAHTKHFQQNAPLFKQKLALERSTNGTSRPSQRVASYYNLLNNLLKENKTMGKVWNMAGKDSYFKELSDLKRFVDRVHQYYNNKNEPNYSIQKNADAISVYSMWIAATELELKNKFRGMEECTPDLKKWMEQLKQNVLDMQNSYVWNTSSQLNASELTEIGNTLLRKNAHIFYRAKQFIQKRMAILINNFPMWQKPLNKLTSMLCSFLDHLAAK